MDPRKHNTEISGLPRLSELQRDATFLRNKHRVRTNVIIPLRELENLLEWQAEWGSLERFLLDNFKSEWEKRTSKDYVGFLRLP